MQTQLVSWLFISCIASVMSSTNEVARKLTCYSCDGRPSNLECNRVAIDRPCPPEQDMCFSEHAMDARGDTLLLKKGCTNRTACNQDRVGCRRHGGRGWNEPQQLIVVCTACCNQELCNRTPPRNTSEAILTIHVPNSANRCMPWTLVLCFFVNRLLHVRRIGTY